MPMRKQRGHAKHSRSTSPRTSTLAAAKVSYVNFPLQDPRDPPPSAEERRAEVEHCLGLRSGDLAPELVARRQREYDARLYASIQESIKESALGEESYLAVREAVLLAENLREAVKQAREPGHPQGDKGGR